MNEMKSFVFFQVKEIRKQGQPIFQIQIAIEKKKYKFCEAHVFV